MILICNNSLSGFLLTDQHLQQKCNQFFFHSLGSTKVRRFLFCVAHVTKNSAAVVPKPFRGQEVRPVIKHNAELQRHLQKAGAATSWCWLGS